MMMKGTGSFMKTALVMCDDDEGNGSMYKNVPDDDVRMMTADPFMKTVLMTM